LVVEDDADVRSMIVRSLEKDTWDVIKAADGSEGLEQLSRKTPTLILLDLMMPVMDGFEFLIEMRSNKDWRNLPVIVLTSKDLTRAGRRKLSGKVEQIVQKESYSGDQVTKLVQQLVNERPGPVDDTTLVRN
jgi:CheY-like chemotaxis protein